MANGKEGGERERKNKKKIPGPVKIQWSQREDDDNKIDKKYFFFFLF